MAEAPAWSDLYGARRRMAARFGHIWSLPVRKRASDVLFEAIKPGSRVLEVGAGDRRMAERIAGRTSGGEYRSVDIDPAGGHDYANLEEVDGVFDCVFAFELVEHLGLDEATLMLREMKRVCRPGATLLLTTPNTHRPQAFLRDATHVTPFAWDELAGLVTLAGFRVRALHRIYNAPVQRQLAHRILFYWVHRITGIDYARTVMLVAERPQEEDGEDE